MKYCQKCGGMLDEKAVICVHCGRSVAQENKPKEADGPCFWAAALGFFIPIVGFILYAVFSDTPQKAKSALNGAIVGVIVSLVLSVLSSIISMVFEYVIYYSFLEFFSEIFEELMYEFI